MLMYIGGTQITPLPMYAPSRMDEPPGTTRTPILTSIFLRGSVSLSAKKWLQLTLPPSGGEDRSTRRPHRNPSRMPFLIQVFTRQPVDVDGSGSADRTCPEESSFRSVANTSRDSSWSAFSPCW